MYVDNLDNKSLIYSGVIHISIMIFMIFGLNFMPKKALPKENIIIVELLPLSSKTNVNTKKHIDQTETKKVAAAKKEANPKSQENEKLLPKMDIKPKPVEDKNQQKLSEIAPKLKDKSIEKPKEKPKDIPKKEDLDDFDSLLKTVDKMEKQIENENKAKKASDKSLAKSNEKNFNPEEPLSISEEDYIRQKVSQNWSVPAGMYGIQDIRVVLLIKFSPDGNVRSIEIKNNIIQSSDLKFKVAIEAAQRAILKASPFSELPKEKYKIWQEYEFLFDPSEMIY